MAVLTDRAFADSSALVKRYVDEDHMIVVRDLGRLTVSAIAGVEVASAIRRRVRVGQIEESVAGPALERVDKDFRGAAGQRPGYAVIRPNDQVLRKASQIVQAHPLRSLDAIQLASAVLARELVPECTGFVCFDDRLRAAAADHGFALVPA